MNKVKVYSNIVLNTLNSILKIIFPFISYKYAAVVLGQDGIGTVNYGSSIINYFVLLAGLGVSTYAIREGAKIRNSKEKISNLASEVFTINLIATIISYVLLLIGIAILKDLQKITLLLIVQSALILFTTLSVEWIYSIYEDYGFIALRNFILQIISIVLMFLFVKDKNDYIIFAGIQVLASSGAFIINFIHAKQRVNIKVQIKPTLIKHLKPIIILFVNNIAVTLYVNSDTTMIGSMLSMSAVGIYSVSVRIYSMYKTIIAAIIMAVLPNISMLSDEKHVHKKDKTIMDTLEVIILFLVPMIFSTLIVGKELILLTSSVEYLGSYVSLVILSFALIFSTIASVLTVFYLIPLKLENYALLSTLIAGIINIILNYFLLPVFGFNAAALTTLLSELVVTIINIVVIRKENIAIFNYQKIFVLTIKGIIASIPLFLIYIIISKYLVNILLILFIYFIVGSIIYVILGYLLNIVIIRNIIAEIMNKLLKK